jgi:hypothetical protein
VAGFIDTEDPTHPMDTTLPLVAVDIATADSSPCHGQLAGWTFALTLPDGGPLPPPPDGGPAYFLTYLASNGEPVPTQTSTSVQGGAIFYNVKAPGNYVNVVSTNTNPDAGCFLLQSPADFSGEVLVAPSTAALLPLTLP